MNYVDILIAVIVAALGYLLGVVLAFVLFSQGRDRAVVEAKLYTERDDALLQCEKLKAENDALRKRVEIMIEALNVAQAEVERLLKANEQYCEAVVELNEEIKALMERNTGLLDALQDAQAEIKSLHMQTIEAQAPEVTPAPKRPPRNKKERSE